MDQDRILKAIRSVIFGMEDGLVSMWGLVVGVSVGSQNSTTVVLAGLSGAVSAALSMAAGEYLSSKSKREVQDAAIAKVWKMVRTHKKRALKKLRDHYVKEGFSKSDANHMIKAVEDSPERIVQQLLEARGHIEQVLEHPAANAGYMFLSFLLASLFPIAPFMLLPITPAEQLSFTLTGVVLFGVGAMKSVATKKHWWSSGIEMLVIGGVAGLSGYIIGSLF